MDIKGLQKEFETTEENIKALQSVGQIIGEVLKQLDEERCMFDDGFSTLYLLILRSHCQGFLRSSICRRMPVQG
jgi:26S proteasome regulatory subunit T4